MKITKIVAQTKRRDRYSVFIDDKFSFGLSELGLIDSGLKTGQELSKEELMKLRENAKTDRIYNQVLGLIARRPRSMWEVEDYLRRKEVEPDAAHEIIAKLQAKKFIDDLDFAVRWVDSRRLLKTISKRKLEAELKQKRISEVIIQQVISDDETNEVEVIMAEIAKKRRSSRYQDDQKLIAYLARQGYRYDDIKQALAGNPG